MTVDAGRARLACALLAICSSTADAQEQVRACGVERWPVKILADKDRASVDFTPRATTIKELGAIPIPEVPYPYDRRLAPHELRVYRVRATIQRIVTEDDSDLHLILRDPTDTTATLIAEIPASSCALGTERGTSYDSVRAVAQSVPRGAVVEVEGVAFFDFIHNQLGRARNGIEIHPVLSITATVPQSFTGGR